ncbi:toxin-antitoxin system YwqK family antitoxin [Fusobacterium massiliense]|jgi:MORN repeat protein|uniref:toxin-antitoxin system YwqK family antitoxin n=1 Tax=Fusobacterium massiliense TaxID=1852365 RepID=UPI0028D75CC5|nr:toxin-antitoxin system YwqK family antitoxin [Fusobacterium massiliense]
MRRKTFILTILMFLFTNIIGLAVENPNPTTQESLIAALNPDFAEGVKEYKPNLENIDKMFNYIEKNIKQKGRAIFYGKLDQEKKELIVTDENNKIIYIEKLPEKLVNSIPYFEVKQTYSLKNGKTLEYSEANFETFGRRIKIKNETLRKDRINKKDAIKALNLIGEMNKASQTGFSKIEYSNIETFDENDNLILTAKFKNNKMIMEEETEGNKVKMITYFDNLNTMNGKMETYKNDTLVSSMQIKNSIPEGEVKIFFPSGKLLSIFNVKNGRPEGVIKTYYENGKIMTTINFKNGIQDGEAIAYDENGNVVEKVLYKNGNIVK